MEKLKKKFKDGFVENDGSNINRDLSLLKVGQEYRVHTTPRGAAAKISAAGSTGTLSENRLVELETFPSLGIVTGVQEMMAELECSHSWVASWHLSVPRVTLT